MLKRRNLSKFEEQKCSSFNINNIAMFKTRMNNYYTYAYLREDGSPYYIGKGKGDRINDTTGRPAKPPKDKTKRIYLKCNLTEQEAFRHEIYMIAVFGRKDLGTGILRNKSNGGEGNSGLLVSQKNKKILKQRMKENNIMNTHRENYLEGIKKRSQNKKWLESKRKIYEITLRSGEVIVVDHLSKFCEERNYCPSKIRGIIAGNRKTHKDIVAAEKLAQATSARAPDAL